MAKKQQGPYWDRLLSDKFGKVRWLKVDWNKWKDEDEIDENDLGFDMGGMENFDMSSLGNMGLGEGGEGEGEDDSDEEEGNIFYILYSIFYPLIGSMRINPSSLYLYSYFFSHSGYI